MLSKHYYISLISMLALLAASVAFAAPKSGAEWSYQGKIGPQHWGQLDAQYKLCATGKAQSPINITDATATRHSPLTIHYVPSAAQAVNNINTLLNIHGKKTVVNDGHTLQINLPQNSAEEYVTVNQEHYWLIQFHFHTPSENKLNGQSFPLEIHFVNQSNDGDLAVLGVMVKEGQYNPALQTFINELPNNKKALKIANKLMVSPVNFLPQNKSYYAFNGSLTTPPCSEDVQWFVFTTPIEASSMQISLLKKLLPQNNARPVQSLNGRAITQVGKTS